MVRSLLCDQQIRVGNLLVTLWHVGCLSQRRAFDKLAGHLSVVKCFSLGNTNCWQGQFNSESGTWLTICAAPEMGSKWHAAFLVGLLLYEWNYFRLHDKEASSIEYHQNGWSYLSSLFKLFKQFRALLLPPQRLHISATSWSVPGYIATFSCYLLAICMSAYAYCSKSGFMKLS